MFLFSSICKQQFGTNIIKGAKQEVFKIRVSSSRCKVQQVTLDLCEVWAWENWTSQIFKP